jgi:hypothetical protein
MKFSVDVVSRDVHQAPMWTLPSSSIVAYLLVSSLSFHMLLSFTLGHSRAEAPVSFYKALPYRLVPQPFPFTLRYSFLFFSFCL